MINATTGAAFLSTGLISLAPNLVLLIFPSYAKNSTASWPLQLGQSLAAGALLGDVFLHTLSHSHDHDCGQWVLVGFTIFFTADLVIRSVDGGGHSHSHNDPQHSKVKSTSNGETDSTPEPASFNRSAVILNLAADSLHNFTDGLSIGASFASAGFGPETTLAQAISSRGGIVTLSVLFHEIPHELGDFCTLIRAGFSTRQAVAAQFLTAVAAMIGTGVALMLQDFLGEKLMLITAGGFVYLGATTILPEILEDNVRPSFRLAQLAAFLTGVSFLYIVAVMEVHDHDHHHSHSHGHDHSHGAHHDHAVHDGGSHGEL